MKTVIVFILGAAVLNRVSCASTNGATSYWFDWNFFTALEIIFLTEIPEDSVSSQDELKDVIFFGLFTISNPVNSQRIYVNDESSLAASNFNPNKPTRIVIHGWQNSPQNEATTLIRDAYLSRGDYNVIYVDWSRYSKITYNYARSKILTVGQYLGQLINFLEMRGMNPDDLTVIGHSLGAHIAGVGCRSAKNRVGVLIGLDPAGPLFYGSNVEARLKSTDAKFTQAVHTNAGVLGHNGKLGDVDIWPNGGTRQTGCGILDIVGTCAHGRASVYFAESVIFDERKFLSHACEDWRNYETGNCIGNVSTYLGGVKVHRDARAGDYYVSTNSATLFAKG